MVVPMVPMRMAMPVVVAAATAAAAEEGEA
jgi:hypothetical protein